MTSGEPELSSYGKRLRAARKAKRMGQVELAKAVGIHQTSVSDLEGDEYEGSLYTAQLAHALGVEAYWLATGLGPRKRSDAALDLELLEDCLAAVEMGAEGRKEPPERKAEIAAGLYEICRRSETKLEPTEILTLLRTMRR